MARGARETAAVWRLAARVSAAAWDEGLFDFLANLLACSYSRYGRRAHHPWLLRKLWRVILATGKTSPREFLGDLDDSVPLRLFREVMSHDKLPPERRIQGFLTERLAPLIEDLVLCHPFMLIGQKGIEIGSDFGTDSADMHDQARMKGDASAMHSTHAANFIARRWSFGLETALAMSMPILRKSRETWRVILCDFLPSR